MHALYFDLFYTKISYASSAGDFKDSSRFRKYFQLHPSEDNLAPVIVALFTKFGWSQVVVITQKENVFVRVISACLKKYIMFG